MPTIPLCSYRYDPLDRLTGHAVEAYAPIQRFYCKSRLATEIDGVVNRSFFQHDDQLLGQAETQAGERKATLLATDQQRSVLHAIAPNESQSFAYSSYGHRPIGNGLLSLLGFNGERPDPVTGHYLLGNGHRAFNPVLMRFSSPDKLSPFGEGGLNTYAYCSGDPINRSDPNGTTSIFLKFFQRIFSRSGSPRQAASRSTFEYTTVKAFAKKGTEGTSTITMTRSKYRVSNGITKTLLVADTISYWKPAPKNTTLQELALSEMSNFSKFNRMNELAFDMSTLKQRSLINFLNHLESNRVLLALQPDTTLDKYKISDFYNKLLKTANDGNLQGVAPSSVKSLPYITKTGTTAYLNEYYEILYRIRSTSK